MAQEWSPIERRTKLLRWADTHLDTLTVADPYIYTNPVRQSVRAGTNVTLSVVAAGAQPLFLQWRKGGSPIPGATNTSLVFTGIQGFDGGSYDVVANDSFGSVTS